MSFPGENTREISLHKTVLFDFSDEPSTEFNLKTYSNSKDLKNAIEKILQKGGLSNVGM